jgi:hypothetical protein
MGENSTAMKHHLIHAILAAIALAICCPPAIADQTENSPMQTTQNPVLKNAQDFIEFFRQGGKYYDDKYLANPMSGNRPDPEAMKVLGEALATDTRDMRRKIIPLLKEIARLEHPKYELRTPEIIDLLVGPGFAKPDGGRSDAMDMLRQYASVPTLSRYGDAFLEELKKEPNYAALLLIAKAKYKGAWEEVDRLSRLPEWKDDPDMRIARAALGDTKIEDEYIAEAKKKEDAGDGEGLAEALIPLVRIGTPRSLRAVCLRMRSPLIIDLPAIRKESVRLSVMYELIYAFPEEYDLLNPSSVREEKDYIRVEEFCTKTVGVKYDGIPRPKFFVSLPNPPL